MSAQNKTLAENAPASRAEALFLTADFDGPRTPRSRAYKYGVMAGLRFRTGEGESPAADLPYPVGTASFDAYFAGVEEGFNIWKMRGIQ